MCGLIISVNLCNFICYSYSSEYTTISMRFSLILVSTSPLRFCVGIICFQTFPDIRSFHNRSLYYAAILFVNGLNISKKELPNTNPISDCPLLSFTNFSNSSLFVLLLSKRTELFVLPL